MKFLKYVGAELEESNEDYSDEFVKRLQKSVEKIKFDRELGCTKSGGLRLCTDRSETEM